MSLTASVAAGAIAKDTLLIGGYLAHEPDKEEVTGTAEHAPALFPNYLPVWEVPQAKYPPLEPFDYVERGKGADATFPDLLGPESRLKDLTPGIGAEISGVQLSQLTDKGKDQLALLAAMKKVLVFRDQDFASIPIAQAVEFGRHFGRLILHPHSGSPAGHPEVHIILRRAGNNVAREFFENYTNSLAWHTDHSFEVQPPGMAFLYALEVPKAGGDTVFVDMEQAYERLSPAFQERLKGLSAVHTGRDQAARAAATGGYTRRAPIETAHPIVRTHPATGKKSLYFNPSNTKKVVGFKKEESDFLLKFLSDHITLGQDMQCRVRWENGTVLVFDNRNTCHSALTDVMDGQRRHLARISPSAERPSDD
ncbi:taurine dioxygenase [Mariannaea sp. PMI_226]|nr:taurine dioxygenase [Mariannaea sp. PMI_226]